VLSKDQASRLLYIRIKIKEAEAELNYLGRCFTDLDDKPNKTDAEQKKLTRVLKKIQTVNSDLEDLWDQQEEVTGGDFVREI
jgi:hypothetical protein